MRFYSIMAHFITMRESRHSSDKTWTALFFALSIPRLLAGRALTIAVASWGVMTTRMQRFARRAVPAGAKVYKAALGIQEPDCIKTDPGRWFSHGPLRRPKAA